MSAQPKNQQARQALAQTNQQLLMEIGQLAQQAEQAEPDQSLKQLANQINSLASQAKFNEQTRTQL